MCFGCFFVLFTAIEQKLSKIKTHTLRLQLASNLLFVIGAVADAQNDLEVLPVASQLEQGIQLH